MREFGKRSQRKMMLINCKDYYLSNCLKLVKCYRQIDRQPHTLTLSQRQRVCVLLFSLLFDVSIQLVVEEMDLAFEKFGEVKQATAVLVLF